MLVAYLGYWGLSSHLIGIPVNHCGMGQEVLWSDIDMQSTVSKSQKLIAINYIKLLKQNDGFSMDFPYLPVLSLDFLRFWAGGRGFIGSSPVSLPAMRCRPCVWSSTWRLWIHPGVPSSSVWAVFLAQLHRAGKTTSRVVGIFLHHLWEGL